MYKGVGFHYKLLEKDYFIARSEEGIQKHFRISLKFSLVAKCSVHFTKKSAR